VAFGVILLYGFLRANYEEYLAIGVERDTFKKSVETARRRKAVNDLLGDAVEEGRKLSGGRRYRLDEDERPTAQERYEGAVHAWVHHTYELIEAAFGKSEAERFLSGEGYRRQGFASIENLRASRDKYSLPVRLWRLDQLIERANALEINPDFDPQEWKQA
jgi:hypothetical protein